MKSGCSLAVIEARRYLHSSVEAAIKPDGNCPNCGTFVDLPGMFHGGGTTAMTMHTHRECPGCSRPLIWFKDGQELPEGWMIDEAEERQRKRRAEPDS